MEPSGGSFGRKGSWQFHFQPSNVTVYNTKTGACVEEPSYVAVSTAEKGTVPGRFASTGRVLEVGKAALVYQNTENVVVYSPLRDGQIADWGAAVCFFRILLARVTSKAKLFKPVLCIHAQQQVTEVEERALIEAGLQAGGRRVYLYQESLPTILEEISQNKMKALKNAIVIHIEPQE